MTSPSFINGSKKPSFYCGHYSQISYHSIMGRAYSAESNLFQDKHLYFVDYVGYLYLSNQELISYPALTMALRQLNDYPIFSKTYTIDQSPCGSEFMKYFFGFLLESEQDFKTEIALRHATVNNLIYLYGHDKVTPWINGINTSDGIRLTINGVTWRLLYSNRDNHGPDVHRLYICKSFDLENTYKKFDLEAFIADTPYLAFRVGKNYQQRGRLTWYSLETFQPVDSNVIKPYQQRIQAIR